MDYVLFGMGYGATLMLLGWVLRTYGPDWKYTSLAPDDIEGQARQKFWIRFVQGLGGVIAIAGVALVFLTFITMLINPDDDTGKFTALVIWGFIIASVFAWCWMYAARFGSVGVWHKSEGYGLLQREKTSDATVERQPQRRPGIDKNPAAEALDETSVEEPDFELIAEDSYPEPHDADDQTGTVEDVIPEPSDDAEGESEVTDDEVEDESEVATEEAEYDFGDGSDTTVPRDIGGRAEAIRRLRERQALLKSSRDSIGEE